MILFCLIVIIANKYFVDKMSLHLLKQVTLKCRQKFIIHLQFHYLYLQNYKGQHL